MLKQDWVIQQIARKLLSVANLVFQKQDVDYTPSGLELDAVADGLWIELHALIDDGKMNEAENRLYARADLNDKRYLEVALDFYAKLNSLSDQSLSAGEFSREEIDEGLKDMLDQFGVTLP